MSRGRVEPASGTPVLTASNRATEERLLSLPWCPAEVADYRHGGRPWRRQDVIAAVENLHKGVVIERKIIEREEGRIHPTSADKLRGT